MSAPRALDPRTPRILHLLTPSPQQETHWALLHFTQKCISVTLQSTDTDPGTRGKAGVEGWLCLGWLRVSGQSLEGMSTGLTPVWWGCRWGGHWARSGHLWPPLPGLGCPSPEAEVLQESSDQVLLKREGGQDPTQSCTPEAPQSYSGGLNS